MCIDSKKVVPILKYGPRDMGQCPQCRGYITQINFYPIMANFYPERLDLREKVRKYEDTDWHCLDCGCRW